MTFGVYETPIILFEYLEILLWLNVWTPNGVLRGLYFEFMLLNEIQFVILVVLVMKDEYIYLKLVNDCLLYGWMNW